MHSMTTTVVSHPRKDGVMLLKVSADDTPEGEYAIRTISNSIRQGRYVSNLRKQVHGPLKYYSHMFHILDGVLSAYDHEGAGLRRPWPVAQLLTFECAGMKTSSLFVQLFPSCEHPLLKKGALLSGTPFRVGDVIAPVESRPESLYLDVGMLVNHVVIQRMNESGLITGTSIGLHLPENVPKWRLATEKEKFSVLLEMANQRYDGKKEEFYQLLLPEIIDICETTKIQVGMS